MELGLNTTELWPQNVTSFMAEATTLDEDEDVRPDYSPFSPLLTGLRTSFIVLNSLLIVIGNIFSLIVMKYLDSPRFPPCSKVFLSYVILSDLAYGCCSVLFIGPAALNYWPYGEFLCKVSNIVESWICSCCVNAAVLITLDRLIAVMYPLRHAVVVPRKRAMIIATMATILSFGFIAALFVSDVEVIYNNNAVMCLVKWSNGTEAYLLRLVLLGCCSAFIPAAILIGCYAKLYLVARKQANRRTALQHNGGSRCARKSARQFANMCALKTCACITLTFCIAWVPYYVYSIRNFVVKKEAPPLVDFVINWLCVCNSWWDVIIYFFMAREFRRTALKLVCRRRWNSSRSQNTPMDLWRR